MSRNRIGTSEFSWFQSVIASSSQAGIDAASRRPTIDDSLAGIAGVGGDFESIVTPGDPLDFVAQIVDVGIGQPVDFDVQERLARWLVTNLAETDK